ncbi:MAG: SMP-30/gluconolactonase/LRE family protein [Roseobacter sp.]
MTAIVFDERSCTLGEGPLWHPTRKQLFWFDILEKKLLTRDAAGQRDWSFDEDVSAAGWVDHDTLLIASATGLWRFDLRDGGRTNVSGLETDTKTTRSNDGRADPWGGFWIGTMGYNAEQNAGAIYRLYKGEIRKLFGDITISNAICFAPDRRCAYFTDTPTGKILHVTLDNDGWPKEAPKVLVDLAPEGLNPDGAVVDTSGNLWVAQWGAARVAVYSDTGLFLNAIPLPAQQVTCPAFGGDDLKTLYATSARIGLAQSVHEASPTQGMTFACETTSQGIPEPQVVL